MGRKRKPQPDNPAQLLLDLGVDKPVVRRRAPGVGHVRFGVILAPVLIEDIDRLVAPTGEGAQDAFERDLAVMEAELDEDGYDDGPPDDMTF